MSLVLNFLVLALITIARGQVGGSETLKPEIKWFAGIDTWQPPANMSMECPYYHAGYDFEGRPVAVIELGHWKSWKYTEDHEFQQYKKYAEKTWWRIGQLKPSNPEAEEGVVLICDLAGYDNAQLASTKLIQFYLTFAIKSAIVEPLIAEFIVINVTFAALALLQVIRSGAGRLIGRAETYGTKTQVWKTVLRNKIPVDQLPPMYGGNVNFKPVHVYG